MSFQLSSVEVELLQCLEESLWREETRFDAAHLAALLAEDFTEIGRSGRVYSRAAIISAPPHPIRVVLPLPEFTARLLSADTALVTYNSIYTHNSTVEKARRTSIWSRFVSGWALRFHQGTPY